MVLDGELAVFILHESHRRVVPVGGFAHLGEGETVQHADDHAESRAMGKNGNGLAVMGLGNPLQGGEEAVQHLLAGLAALDGELVQLTVEAVHLLLIVGVQLLPNAALPNAHVDLAESGLEVEGETLGLVDGLGGGAGAEEVGGVHRVNVDIFKAAAENVDLTVAAVGNKAVILPVGNAVEVALRLGVADEIDGCHTMLTHSFRDFLALSTSSALRRV